MLGEEVKPRVRIMPDQVNWIGDSWAVIPFEYVQMPGGSNSYRNNLHMCKLLVCKKLWHLDDPFVLCSHESIIGREFGSEILGRSKALLLAVTSH